MEREEMIGALEAILFAAGEPMTVRELKGVFERYWVEMSEEELARHHAELEAALTELRARWGQEAGGRGFVLLDVAEGMSFRTNPHFAGVLQAMREQRPVRLSKAALETLAIVAYRQPTTKPEIDQIRGVDCTATIKLLLDRHLIRIVGKRDEPGRPILYGTTREFLSFFNLKNLTQLPSLREYHELSEESREEVEELEAKLGLEELSQAAKKIKLGDEPAVQDLEQAVAALRDTEGAARDALAAEGIALEPGADGQDAPGKATSSPDASEPQTAPDAAPASPDAGEPQTAPDEAPASPDAGETEASDGGGDAGADAQDDRRPEEPSES